MRFRDIPSRLVYMPLDDEYSLEAYRIAGLCAALVYGSGVVWQRSHEPGNAVANNWVNDRTWWLFRAVGASF
jgi:hypothetical protein